MNNLTAEQKKVLHHCPKCSHLLDRHDGAGCMGCLNDFDSEDVCGPYPQTVVTTYAAVADLLAAARVDAARQIAAAIREGIAGRAYDEAHRENSRAARIADDYAARWEGCGE